MRFRLSVMHHWAYFHPLNSQESKIDGSNLAFATTMRACRAVAQSRVGISPQKLPHVHQHGSWGRVRSWEHQGPALGPRDLLAVGINKPWVPQRAHPILPPVGEPGQQG